MREEAVQFGWSNLIGVVSEPDEGDPGNGKPGILLLNSGLISKIGPNRLYVTLARRLAEKGFTVLRFDLSAIGDSPIRGDTLPFRASSVRETQEAITWLRGTRGLQGFLLAGICTGAVVAFRTALVTKEVYGAALVNAQDLVTDQSSENQAYLATRASAHYYMRTAILQPWSWLKLLTGQANYHSILRALRAKIPKSTSGKATLDTPEAQEVREGMKWFVHNRGHLLLLYSEGDPGIDELDLILGKDPDWMAESPRVSYQIMPRADHMFTPSDKQEAFLKQLEDWAVAASARIESEC